MYQFNRKVIFTFKDLAVFLKVNLTNIRAKIPGKRVPLSEEVGRYETMGPHRFSIRVGKVITQPFHSTGRTILFTLSVVNEEEHNWSSVPFFGWLPSLDPSYIEAGDVSLGWDTTVIHLEIVLYNLDHDIHWLTDYAGYG
ncbi:hypothetical protein ACQKFG_08490 [Peribacillus sp. NPDC076916]|uniref:hypothetical protein n=1 Tax=Peribacillus sp. NPDC076916 TaxID=3390608 RepID=UPI003CFDCC39